jgi:signal transduction histidine kinase/CheY-like chemotaxis protein
VKILNTINSETGRKKFLIYAFTSVALFSLAFFGMRGFSEKPFLYNLIVLSYFLMALINLILLRIFNWIKLSSIILLTLMFSLEIILFTYLGEGNSGVLWFYIFPPLVFALVSSYRAFLVSFSLIIVGVLIFVLDPPFLFIEYSTSFIIRLSVIYIALTGIISLFEYARKQTYLSYLEKLKEVNRQNRDLIKKEEELMVARFKSEESNRLKSAFLANMSHEIRTPLNAIVGFAELLHDGASKDQKTYTQVISNSGHHLSRIIDDIIDFSKIESGQVDYTESEIDINEFLKELFQVLIKEKNDSVAFAFNFGIESDKAIIKTDKARLQQVVSNVLSNAFKYTSKGQVMFSYKIENDFLKFEIEDSGIGIDNNDIEHVFDHFTRSHIHEKNIKFSGTGLGLAISKSCVNLLGGDILLNSELNKGTKVTFTIAYNPVYAISNKQQGNLSNTEEEDKQMSEIKLLIAEDEESNYEFLKYALESYMPNISHVVNGQQMVDAVKTQRFDLVLADIRMPIMDGLEATKAIRKFNESIVIIAQTANAFDEDKFNALASGCNAFITKPIKIQELIATIKTYMRIV